MESLTAMFARVHCHKRNLIPRPPTSLQYGKAGRAWYISSACCSTTFNAWCVPPLARYMHVWYVTWNLRSSCCSEPQCTHKSFYQSDVTHVRKCTRPSRLTVLQAKESWEGPGNETPVSEAHGSDENEAGGM